MAKKVLSKIIRKREQYSKARFLVLFFVLGFILMSIPLAHRAAVVMSTNNWHFQITDFDDMTHGGVVINADGHVQLGAGFLSGFLETGLISPEMLTSWEGIGLDINLPGSETDDMLEYFDTNDNKDGTETTANWNTQKQKVTLPISWNIAEEKGRSADVFENNIAWSVALSVIAGEVYRCDIDLNGSSGGCLADDEKIKIYNGTYIGDVKVTDNYVFWQQQSSIYGCDLRLDSADDGSCYLGKAEKIIAGGVSQIGGVSENYISYATTNLDIIRYDIVAESGEVVPDVSGLPDYTDISGDYVVWNNIINNEIYIYNFSGEGFSTPTMISDPTSGAPKSFPQVSKNYVVWVDATDGVVLYDIKMGNTETIMNSSHGDKVAISGDFVVFCDEGKVYMHQISSEDSYVIQSDTHSKHSPVVSGNKVLYGSIGDSYNNKIGFTQLDFVNKISNSGYNFLQLNPSVYDGVVAWQDGRNFDEYSDGRPGDNMDIYLASISGGWERRITTNTEGQKYPDVWGSYVVWQDGRNYDEVDGGVAGVDNMDIYMCDRGFDGGDGGCLQGDEKTQITIDTEHQVLPQVFDNTIVWQDWRNGVPNIYGYDIAAEEDFRITQGSESDKNPKIDNDYIVWERLMPDRQTDIYMCDLSISEGIEGSCFSGDAKFKITDTADASEESPDVYGNYIVWHTDEGIYLYNILHDESRLIVESEGLARIYGDYVVWSGEGIYHIPTGIRYNTEEFALYSAISKNNIVWQDALGEVFTKTMLEYLNSGVAQSVNIAPEDAFVTSVSVDASQTIPEHSSIKYLVSNNGSDWDYVGLREEYIFDTIGSELMWKAELSSERDGYIPEIDKLALKYRVGSASASLKLFDEDGVLIPERDYTLSDRIDGISLSDMDVSEYDKFSMRLDMASTSLTDSPTLRGWKVGWRGDTAPPLYILDSLDLTVSAEIGNTEIAHLDVVAVNSLGDAYTLPTTINFTLSDDSLGGFVMADGALVPSLEMSIEGGSVGVDYKPHEDTEGEVRVKVCSDSICDIEAIQIVEEGLDELKVFIINDAIVNSSFSSDGTNGNIWYGNNAGDPSYTGIEAADMMCQNQADLAGIDGIYRAWLSTDEYNPADNWEHSTRKYVLPEGELVADDWDDLTSTHDGVNLLQNKITQDAFGNLVGSRMVFTGTNSDGGAGFIFEDGSVSTLCSRWTDYADPTLVLCGTNEADSLKWTEYLKVSCSTNLALYCFQQDDICGGCDDGMSCNRLGICVPELCGDSVIEEDLGEVCDDGGDNGTIPLVGYGESEETCNEYCQLGSIVGPYCGDGIIDPEHEQCDDGDTVSGNGSGNGCSATCVIEPPIPGPSPVCGNGILERGEACDDSNTVDTDSCSNSCVINPGPGPDPVPPGVGGGGGSSVCGNNVLESGETCDDGNLENLDGCDFACQIEEGIGGGPICGDDYIDIDEECDGSNLDGQSCRSFDEFGSGSLKCTEACNYDFSECSEETEIIKAVAVVASIVQEKITEPIVKVYKEKVLENKIVQEANEVYVAPIITSIAAINLINTLPIAATAVPFLQLLLQFLNVLFTEPTYIFAKRRRKWGIVYNSATKEPVSLAVVRLYDAETQHLVTTRVTDSSGRYYFIGDPKKKYRIDVKAHDYDFPSKTSINLEASGNIYKKMYFGGEIDLSSQKIDSQTAFGTAKVSQSERLTKSLINYDIPVDLKHGLVGVLGYSKKIKTKLDTWDEYRKATVNEKSAELKRIKRQIFEKKASSYIAFFGFTITTVSLLISPSAYMLGLFSLHSILLATFIFFAHKHKAVPWGKVFDKESGKGVSKALVRLFDIRFGKLLMTQVTVSNGRYGFMAAEKEKYMLTGEKDGYRMTKDFLEVEGDSEGLVKKEIEIEKYKKKENDDS